MGAIRPWHIIVLGACFLLVAAVVLTIVVVVQAANKNR
jgi:hypothetical protein